jgi:L-asparaginase
VARTTSAQSAAPRIVVFGLGGTIAMTAAATGGVTPTLSPQQLLDAVPGLRDTGIPLDVVNFRSRPGASLTFDDLAQLAAAIRKHVSAGATGVVITQGTDTIEETAYLLDLLHDQPQPVVVTGAMRNPTLAGADGPANLLAAVQVAASPVARDLGCLVVLADEIHAAARVRKMHSTSPAAFASANGGPMGYLVEGAPVFTARPAARYVIPQLPVEAASPRVALYTATLGDDGALLSAVSDRLDGLVVAGFGVGHVPDTWLDLLTELAARMPVVLTSRTGAGPVLTSTYGFPGSERDLITRGLIPGGFLDPYKARIVLHLALAAGADAATVAAALQAAGNVADAATWPWRAVSTAAVH